MNFLLFTLRRLGYGLTLLGIILAIVAVCEKVGLVKALVMFCSVGLISCLIYFLGYIIEILIEG